MELTIDLKSLQKSELYIEEFVILALINAGEDLNSYPCSKITLMALEATMYIKPTEEGYELRGKGRELFENAKKSDSIDTIITYLNEKTGKKFSTKSAANRKFIAGRLGEKYTEEDLKKVIDTMVSKWAHDPKMSMYLRPETLFNPTKFQTYINMIVKEDKDWTAQRV